MLDVITGFFGYVSDMFTVCYDVFVEYMANLSDAMVVIYSLLARLPVFFAWLPATVIPIIISTFVFVILFKILGR